MEQKVIEKSQERCIFLIHESNFDFYLIIPNSKKVNLVLTIFQNIQDEQIRIFPFYQDKAIVAPIVDSRILTGLKENQENFFQYFDKFLSNLINVTYQILTYNHIEVDFKILFNNDLSYIEFNRWYTKKYNGRVELIQLETTPQPVKKEVQTEASLTSTPTLKEETLSTIDSLPPDDLSENNTVSSTKEKEPGFVSYVLLGVVVAVISLIFLYFLI